MVRLGVNIDHVATVRQARHESFPDPVTLALECCHAGAQGITAHLREDRRHIQDEDIFRLKDAISVPFNLEMALSSSVISVAKKVQPAWVCIVPEKRQELTTEGGLKLSSGSSRLSSVIDQLKSGPTRVSLFVEATIKNMHLASALRVDAIELHTGRFAQCWEKKTGVEKELKKIRSAARAANRLGLLVNAGHGLNYENVGALLKAHPFHELNIGFAIVARALMVGMKKAVKEMKQRMTA